jgi:hypothetical protein
MDVAKRAPATPPSIIREAWVEVALNPDWMVAHRLVATKHGEPVIAEIRLFPRERTKMRPPGRWSADVLGVDARVPAGGIPADILRHIRLGETRRFHEEFRGWLQKARRTKAAVPSVAATKGGKLKRGRRAKHSEEFLATLARDYVDALTTATRSPVADVARNRSLAASQVRDLLHRARHLALLTPTRSGRSGGQLTDRALGILNRR